jgi:hypothetical protein
MRLSAGCVIVAGALIAFSIPAQAGPISAGDYVTLTDGPGTTGGGEFNLTVNGAQTFITFCLQRTEYIDFTHTFRVDSVNTYTLTDPVSNGGDALGRDYLSSQTAYLYTMFRAGTLSGYAYSGSGRTASANALQNAIWMFENEMAMNALNPFVMLANKAVASGAWSGLGQVRVLNLSRNGVEAQDQLALQEIPEPGVLLFFGTGLILVALTMRRRRTQTVRRSA